MGRLSARFVAQGWSQRRRGVGLPQGAPNASGGVRHRSADAGQLRGRGQLAPCVPRDLCSKGLGTTHIARAAPGHTHFGDARPPGAQLRRQLAALMPNERGRAVSHTLRVLCKRAASYKLGAELRWPVR